MKILETRRLLFRHQVPEDLDDLYALYSDPEIIQFIPDAPRSYEETRQELMWHRNGHPQHPELGLWATVYKENNTFIGRCGLLPWTVEGQYEVEVAFLISKTRQGQGLGTEAAWALMNYGFDKLKLSRLVCLIEKENAASIKVAEKIGMSFEKESRDETGPFLLYSIQNKAQ